jgi:hypothetical protein
MTEILAPVSCVVTLNRPALEKLCCRMKSPTNYGLFNCKLQRYDVSQNTYVVIVILIFLSYICQFDHKLGITYREDKTATCETVSAIKIEVVLVFF